MAKKYDVIVVGAGLAGFLAAKAAGENGLDVALLERNPDPTLRSRACGETLVSMNEYWMGNITGFNSRDKRIFFSSDAFSFKYDGPYQNIYAVHMYTPGGYKVKIGDLEEQRKKGEYGRVGLAFDKETMFRCLLEEVKSCSVEVFPDINIEKVTSVPDGVMAEGSGQSFEGRYLIAADGTNSKVARVMGMNAGRTYYCNLHAISYHMSGVEPPESNVILATFAYMKDDAARLFVLPQANEGIYNILIYSLNPRLDLEEAGDYFMQESFCAPWFKNAKKLRTFFANENCYTPIVEPYKDRVLVAGDVGSTQELENPGAMISGWKAGQAISNAVQEENLGLEIKGVSRYVNWWKEAYVNYYDTEFYIKAFSTPYILTSEEEVNYVNGLIKETLPACWHPFTLGVILGNATAKVIHIIQRERPDIFQKMQRRSLPATQIYAEVAKISKPVL